MSQLTWLDPLDDAQAFPPLESALSEPDGLLAVGGDLSAKRLISAYQQGIFPWYCDGQPILWWSPDPRLVLLPQNVKISRSLAKVIKRATFSVSTDSVFNDVVHACSTPRTDQDGTWITTEMATAYSELHYLGIAHSVECWYNDTLVGGLYGIALGQVFFGESMFSYKSDASKVALVYLCRQLQHWGYVLIDCQMRTEHLLRMGAHEISRAQYSRYIRKHAQTVLPSRWQFDTSIIAPSNKR